MDALFLGLFTLGFVWFLIAPGFALEPTASRRMFYIALAFTIVGAMGFVWQVAF